MENNTVLRIPANWRRTSRQKAKLSFTHTTKMDMEVVEDVKCGELVAPVAGAEGWSAVSGVAAEEPLSLSNLT
eukprot:scaffold29029_cov86-Attheya_sp.AAC.2